MKTEYKYITFLRQPSKGLTLIFACVNNNSGGELGTVKWYGSWRQYCYFPSVQAVYSAGCLRDIAEFIEQLMSARQNKTAVKKDE